MSVEGMIFDVDGTLIDSNRLHAEGWRRAFEQCGYKVHLDRIELEIGKGGDNLVPAILGEKGDQQDGDALRKLSAEEYQKLARSQRIPVIEGALGVMEALKARGIRTAIATSSKKSHMAATNESSGVVWSKVVDEFVGADETDRTKPAAGPVEAAAEKLGLSPAQCVMVGDTIYDGESAHRAGAAFIGVLTGYGTEAGLRRAGARAVVKTVGEIERNLDEVLARCSRSALKLDQQTQQRLMREALAIAEEGMGKGQLPIGCVIASGDGSIISRAHNSVDTHHDLTAHAEMEAFRLARGKLGRTQNDLILVSTLEPCVMCTGAAMQGMVDVVIYGLRAPADSGTARVQFPETPENQMPRVIGNVLADESRNLLRTWLDANPEKPSAAYVKQLMQLQGKTG